MMEHIRVLSDIGVTSVVKPGIEWCSDPDVLVVVAEHEQLGMVGGFRIQLDKPGIMLPMEKALVSIDPRICDELSRLRMNGNGELTALWNAHRFAGKGVPFLLMSTLVATAIQLPLDHLTILVSNYMESYASRNGFKAFRTIGAEGKFNYPIPGFESYAMVLEDVRLLEHLSLEDRHRIISLRIRPVQTRAEQPRSAMLEVHYDLQLENAASSSSLQSREIDKRHAA
jgi:hypothetical protein